MKKHLLLSALLLCVAFTISAQTSYTKTFNFPAGGEACQGGVTPYKGGFLLASAYYGNSNGTIENVLRMVNANDSVERTIRFGDEFHHYFQSVVTTDNRIFVFGVQTFSTSTEVNYVILDSMFNVLQQKKLVVPYSIIFCRFFKAKDGGVIGSVHELCDESRVFRLDADGNLLWIKSYVGIVQPPGGYDRTIINTINLFGGNRYLITGYLGFGCGSVYFTIDDSGLLLNSLIIENFFTGTNSDVLWKTAFDGEKALSIVNNAYDEDSTFLIEVDTGLNILNCKRIIHSDSIAQPRKIISTPTEFVCAFAIATYPPYTASRVAITGFDKLTLQPNWTIETRCDTVQDATFYFFDGGADANGVPTWLYNYGPIDFAPNGGNNYDDWGLTKLDPVSHDGFCDKQVATTTVTPGSYIVTSYYMDTIPHPYCYVTSVAHATTTVALGAPTLLCGYTIGIDEQQAEESLSLFPNPTTGITHLDNFYFVTVTDIHGKEIMNSVYTNEIDLGGEAPGMYFVVVRDEEGKMVGRGKVVRE